MIIIKLAEDPTPYFLGRKRGSKVRFNRNDFQKAQLILTIHIRRLRYVLSFVLIVLYLFDLIMNLKFPTKS